MVELKQENCVDSYSFLAWKGNIFNVSETFLTAFGYQKAEALGNDSEDFLLRTLRTGANLEKGSNHYRCFAFTKSREATEVIVSFQNIKPHGLVKYHISEVPGSRLQQKLPFAWRLMKDNHVGIGIYSAADLQLLAYNSMHYNCIPNPKPDDIHGLCLKEFIDEFTDSPAEQMWNEIIQNNESRYFTETHGIYKGWEQGYYNNSILPVEENGRAKYIISMLQDVTETVDNRDLIESQNRKQQEFLQQALEMKDQFISLITHELKTPLSVIDLSIQMIEMTCASTVTPKLEGYLKNIRQNTYRQMRLVNNLLDITRASSGHAKVIRRKLDIVSFSQSLIESVRLYAEQKNISLVFACDMAEVIVNTDEEKYERILLNLLSNAIKFSPAGKPVVVTVGQDEEHVKIEVRDEGIGIPEDKQQLIFERFGQVESSLSQQAEGTGIGLALVKQFVDALGGRITLQSELGAGSAFCVLLPSEAFEDDMKMMKQQPAESGNLDKAVSIEFSHLNI